MFEGWLITALFFLMLIWHLGLIFRRKRGHTKEVFWNSACRDLITYQLLLFDLQTRLSLFDDRTPRQDVLSVNHLSETHVHSVICLPGTILFLLDFLNLSKSAIYSSSRRMSALQIPAFLSGLAGLGATIGATVSNEWRATSRASSVITATWVLQGLWNNCAGNAIGALHCRPHHTMFSLEGKRLSRGIFEWMWTFWVSSSEYQLQGVCAMFVGSVLVYTLCCFQWVCVIGDLWACWSRLEDSKSVSSTTKLYHIVLFYEMFR